MNAGDKPQCPYVVGFMFDASRMNVALIRKNKPAWQRGKLNGIGGKIEAGESSVAAMVREFREETSYDTSEAQWEHFLTMRGESDGGWCVECFATVGDLTMVKSAEDEKTERVRLHEITPLRPDMIENLPWLIPLALDYLHDRQPRFVHALYS